MKQILLILFFLTITIFTPARANSLPDSIVNHCTLLAARGEVAQLRPLYRQFKKEFPKPVRIFCDLAIAHAEGDHSRTNQCVDSLLNFYPRLVNSSGRLTLAKLKAENLFHDGLYKELQAYANEQITYLRRHNFKATHIEVFRTYLRKAKRYGSSGENGRILGLAERKSDFELLRTYHKSQNLTDFARLTAMAEINRAFNRPKEASLYADSLLRFYSDSLDTEAQTQYVTTVANYAMSNGLWPSLAELCQFCTQQALKVNVPIKEYTQIAEQLTSKAPFRLVCPNAPTSIPTTRDWPLLLPASINGGSPVFFQINTGQHFTIITEDDARLFGAQTLSATLPINTMYGKLNVHPAFLSELHFGDIKMQNLLVYVVPKNEIKNDMKPELYRILGDRDLMRLGVIDFYPEKMVITPTQKKELNNHPNLRIGNNLSLQLQADYKTNACDFSLETGSPGNVLSSIVFPADDIDTLNFHLTLNNKQILVPSIEFSPMKDGNSCGILGLPFLRSYAHVRMDFNKMELSLDGQQSYYHRYLTDYTADGDLFGLERNAPALLAVAEDDVAENFLHFLVEKGKNIPNSIITLANQLEPILRKTQATDELLLVTKEKARALSSIGQYAGAAACCHDLLTNNAYTGNARQQIAHYEQLLHAAVPYGAPQFEIATDSLSVPFNFSGKSIDVQIGSKTLAASIDITQPITTLSAKTAEKLNAKIIFHDTNKTYAFLSEINIGTAKFRNIICQVINDHQNRLILGFNLFRLTPTVTLTQNKLIISKKQLTAGSTLRFDKYLCAQGETSHGYITFRLKMGGKNSLLQLKSGPFRIASTLTETLDAIPGDYNEQEAPYQGELSVEYLINKQGSLTFDFKNMMMN